MRPEKQRSLRALDFFNFFNAGIQTGLGPFIAIYYEAARHWNPGRIGILLALQSLAGVAIQSFVGHWVDVSHHKRAISAAAAITVALGCLGVVTLPGFGLQCLVQVVIGLSVTVFPAATSAFALGLVEQKEISKRIARNESYTHAGNVVFAAAAALVGQFIALAGVLQAAGLFATGMAGAVFSIRGNDVNYDAARESHGDENGQPQQKSFRDLIRDRRILVFTAAVVLFNAGNSATLPLIGQLLSKGQKSASVWQTAACVIVAEIVMVGVAALVGRRADSWGRKPLFLVAFGILALRDALTVVSHGQWYLISLQSMDGIAAAIYGVLLTLVAADLARGTGRFNFLQGGIQSAMGLGAFLSNSLFGWIAKSNFNASFWGLSAAAALGGLLYLWRMPETRPD